MSTNAGVGGLVAELQGLRSTTPTGFTERVLGRLGLPGEVDQFVLTEGPAGPLFIAFSRVGVNHVLAAAVVNGVPEDFVARHLARFGRPARPATRPPAGLRTALQTGRATGLVFDLRGLSEFERAVLAKALQIPPGEVRPYGWVAREIDRPKAARAVGSALGRNPVPVLIPCHRVVRSDGQVGQYASGPAMKRALLGAEGLDVVQAEALGRSGVRLVGSDSTKIFCFPTCRHARRMSGAHQVTFRSADQAAEAGYRPCAHCRPAPVEAASA